MSLSKKSKILLILILVIAIGAFAAYKMAYKPHTAITDMEVAFTGKASDFLEKIKNNPENWTQGGKVVELTGIITAKDEKGVSINESVYFQLQDESATATLKEGQNLKIKGRVIGYDDLLEELKLDKGILTK